jgi:hypothetical protein
MFVCLLIHCFSIDLRVRLWLLTFGCRLFFRLLVCGGPLVRLAVSWSTEPLDVCCWSCGGWVFLGSSRAVASSRDPAKSSGRGVLSLDASNMARWSFYNTLVSILCQLASVSHKTHSSMTKFYTKSLAVSFGQISRVMGCGGAVWLVTYRSDSVISMSVSHVSKPSSTKAS